MPSASPQFDAIIAGAGISGLSAARHLALHGRRVLVLESRDRTSGRIHTHTLPKSSAKNTAVINPGSHNVDLGASFVHGIIENPLTVLSKKVPFALHSPPEESMQFFMPDGQMLPDEVSERLSYFTHSTVFGKLREYAQRGDSVPDERESLIDGMNKDDEAIWGGMEQREKDRVRAVSEMWSGWTGAPLSTVSLKWWGFERDFHGEEMVVRDGYSALIDWTAREIVNAQTKGNSEIKLNTKVTSARLSEEDDAAVFVRATHTEQGEEHEFSAKHFICSLPLGVLQRTPPKFDPPLPPRRVQSLHRLGMGLLNKVILSYDEPWWDPDCSWFFLLPSSFPDRNADRATKKIGAASTNEESKNREREHLLRNDALLLQNYVPVTGRAALVAYVGPPRAQTVEALPSERVAKIFHERAAAALHHNTSKDGGPPSMKPAEPTHTVVTRWAADPHSCGSYTYLPNRSEGREGAGPMDILECGRPLWGERLGFCGEHTSSDHYASVHGALLEGLREGARVESLLREAEKKDRAANGLVEG